MNRPQTISMKWWFPSLSRPVAACAAILLFRALGALQAQVQQGPLDLDIIDCHTHFYDPTRPEGVPFPAKGTPLYRTTLPEHLRAQKMFRKVTGTVIVEASAWVEDNAWLLQLAEKDPFVVGIVGNLQPGSPTFAKDLDRFASNPLFRGIRISGSAAEKLLEADAVGDLQRLADRDLALDVVHGSAELVARLAGRLPALRIVLNHSGGAPVTAAGPTVEWTGAIRAAAKHPNVFCKISHLVRTALHEKRPPGTTELDFYRPYLDVMWEAFGEERVIYASNWPVSEAISDYEALQRIPLLHAFEKGEAATRKFCSLNAQRAYRWVERPGRR